MRILWDKDKARINEEKHGVTFEEAAEVLSGDYIEFESNANGEKRSRAVTRIRGEYLTVVYARRGETKRIISARHSSQKERQQYERYDNQRA
ncbi:BrnT family toxin [Paratractidigestivibacter sp.]|mgnify:FL=1|uniref:BrnT family toxin n=1 Tax=Paratractidigestivibacter sp. TaxID=2847316 RepID=UPI003AB1E496